MKAITAMFDSPHRRMAPTCGCDGVRAPSGTRPAERAANSDSMHVSSLPCLPARRELASRRGKIGMVIALGAVMLFVLG
ncbi:MAG: hypothetical protein ACUVX9_10745 [Anaerolineae bacterium]